MTTVVHPSDGVIVCMCTYVMRAHRIRKQSRPTFVRGSGPTTNFSYKIQRSAKRRGCLLSYSQAEPGRELTQPSPRLLAEPCSMDSIL